MVNNELNDIMKLLDLPQDLLHKLMYPCNYAAAEAHLRGLKTLVSKRRRVLAAKYHPDKFEHAGPEAVKCAKVRMQSINEVCDNLMKSRIQPMYRRPDIVRTWRNTSPTDASASSSSSWHAGHSW